MVTKARLGSICIIGRQQSETALHGDYFRATPTALYGPPPNRSTWHEFEAQTPCHQDRKYGIGLCVPVCYAYAGAYPQEDQGPGAIAVLEWMESLRRRTDKAFFVGMSDLHYDNVIAGLRREQEEGHKAVSSRTCHCRCTSPPAPPHSHERGTHEQAQSSEQSCQRPLQDVQSPHRDWSPVSRRRPTMLPHSPPPPPPLPPKKPQGTSNVAWQPKGLDWSNSHGSQSSSNNSSSGGRHEQPPSPPPQDGLAAVTAMVQDLVLQQRLNDLLHSRNTPHRQQDTPRRSGGGRQGDGKGAKGARGVAPLVLGLNFPVGLERPPCTYRPPPPPRVSSPSRPVWKAQALAATRHQIRQRRQHRPWVGGGEGEGLGGEELVRALRGAGHSSIGDEMVSVSRLSVSPPSPTHTAPLRFSLPSSGSVWPCLSVVAMNSPSTDHHCTHHKKKKTAQQHTGGRVPYASVVGMGTRAACPTHLLSKANNTTLTASAHKYDTVAPTILTQPRTRTPRRRKQA